MEIKKNERNGYTITRDDGTIIELTANEVSLLRTLSTKDDLRDNITYAIEDLKDEGKIDPDQFDGGMDGFVEEICKCFEDDVEQTGQLPDEDELKERILDEAEWYDGVLSDEDEDEEED